MQGRAAGGRVLLLAGRSHGLLLYEVELDGGSGFEGLYLLSGSRATARSGAEQVEMTLSSKLDGYVVTSEHALRLTAPEPIANTFRLG